MNARILTSTLLTLALAACGGGGGAGGIHTIPVAPQPTPGTAGQKVAISLVVPVSNGNHARRPAYISASALGAGIVVTQGSATVSAVVDLSAGSSACSGSGASRTCTATVTVPLGTDVFTVTIYSQAPVGGVIPSNAQILGVGSSSVDVVLGQTTSVPVYVGGQIASFGATLPTGSLPADGVAHPVALVIAPTDFGDNPITAGVNDPYANPITVAITESGGSGHATVSLNGGAPTTSVVVTHSSDTLAVSYDGGGSPGYSFTITLSATGVTSQSATIAPLIAAIAGTTVTSVPLNGTVSHTTITFGEAGSATTYTSTLTTCTNIATAGAIAGSGASATIAVTGGTLPSASGCTLKLTDAGNTSLVLPMSNTPVGGTVSVAGTTITEYTGFTTPYGIAKGPDGNMWFTDQGADTIYAFNSSNDVANSVSLPGSDLFDITTGSDGALWMTDQNAEGVDRATTSGIVTSYPSVGSPFGITSGPNGTMLVAVQANANIWQLDVGGQITILPFTPSGSPTHVVWVPGGTNGSAWFAESNYIGDYNIDTATLAAETTVPNGSTANYITYGPDDNIWFTASGGTAPFIGVINPATPATVTQIALAAGSTPMGIVSGVDNAMWFVDPGNNVVGEVNLTSHVVSTFPIPTAASGAQEIALGPDGSLWFTEHATGNIGHVVP